ncbi:hypothetical protein CCACVL1_17164, partial [Corchorus capsularis]
SCEINPSLAYRATQSATIFALHGNREFFQKVSCKLFDNLAKLKLSFTNKR